MKNQDTGDSFDSLKLNENILKAVELAGYTKPSPIQIKAIPAILEGRDLFGCAQTGTGKTAAFALPVMQMIEERGHYPKPLEFRALILTPTRELAEQIATNISLYGKFLKISHCKVYGGVGAGPQIRALSKGVDILVATPGRLLDLFKQNKLRFSGVEFLILDEADRMLDMGFIPDIRRICAQLPKKRQSMLFSATLSQEIAELAKDIVNDPLRISVSPDKPTVEKISQSVAFLERDKKLDYLETLMRERLEKSSTARALVFCRTKHGANKLAKKLTQSGLPSDAIHGNKSQSARQRALDKFKSCECPILVATDIAARGIDVKDMPLVINFDLPEAPETYVHRIGRTARAESDGEAISLCTDEDVQLMRDIEKFVRRPIPANAQNPFHAAAVAAKLSRKGGEPSQPQAPRNTDPRQHRNGGGSGVRRKGKSNFQNSKGGPASKRAEESPKRGFKKSEHPARGARSESGGRKDMKNSPSRKPSAGKGGFWQKLKSKFV